MTWKRFLCLAYLPLIILLLSATCTLAEDEGLEETIVSFVDGMRLADVAAVRSTIAPQSGPKWKTLPKYPILQKLGSAISASIERRTFSDLLVAVASVRHRNGHSTWQFKITADDKLIDAQFLDAEVSKPRWSRRRHWGYRQKHRPDHDPKWGADVSSPSPTPASCATSPSLCSPSHDKTYDARLVEFFYATDRNVTVSNNIATLDAESGRSGQLSYGIAAVHIPKDHEPGRIELPSEWRFLGIELKSSSDENKHFSIKRLASVSLEDWKVLMKKQAEETEKKTALIFVHGFNTTFEQALLRNAQIVWDLGYDGVSLLYSWSSRGKVRDYVYDRDSAEIAQPGFIALLGILRDLGIEHVNVIAHSMGNRVVLPALSGLAGGENAIRLNQLIMAAPDVARDQFINQLPLVQKITEGTTLYASSADKALLASAELARFPRAGLVPPEGPVILPKLDTIDVTAVGSELLGLNHTVFASNRAVMDDLKLLIVDGMKLPRLSQVKRAPEPPKPPTYWKYK
jgi:esterase/lipase superfamily enzyme